MDKKVQNMNLMGKKAGRREATRGYVYTAVLTVNIRQILFTNIKHDRQDKYIQ